MMVHATVVTMVCRPGRCSPATITMNTMLARPLGPNQPMNIRVPRGDARGDYVDTLRAAIIVALMRGRPNMHDIARSTGNSVRTMQRRLGMRGTTFSRVLLDVRQHGAYTMLRNTGMPLTAIAVSLGYSELSSFTRAFRQWSGLSPSAFRAGGGWTGGGAGPGNARASGS